MFTDYWVYFLQAIPCEDTLPSQQNLPCHGMKLHQVYQRNMEELEQILSGYTLPEPYFSERLKVLVDSLLTCLKDSHLPLLELQVRTSTFHSNMA